MLRVHYKTECRNIKKYIFNEIYLIILLETRAMASTSHIIYVTCFISVIALLEPASSQYWDKQNDLSDSSLSRSVSTFSSKHQGNIDENLKNRHNLGSKKQSAHRSKSNRTGIIRKPTVKRIVHPSLHAAWDEYNHLCVLAKFQATFTIKYETSSGTARLMDKMPANARSKGRCDQFDEEPVLDVMWKDSQLTGSQSQRNSTGGFTFRIIFQKFGDEGRWGVQQMQLLYNTGHPVFRGATQPRKFIVRSNKEDYRLQFHTNMANSMLCPSPPPIQMYDSDGTLRVIARLSNMQLEAFEFSDPREANNFDSFMRCEQVSFGAGVAHPLTTIRNDSLTFAIGIMTVCIATLTVVGYAIYRSHVLGTGEYKNVS